MRETEVRRRLKQQREWEDESETADRESEQCLCVRVCVNVCWGWLKRDEAYFFVLVSLHNSTPASVCVHLHRMI